MAERARMINWKAAGLPFDQRAWLRLAIWGGAAAGALLVAVLTAHSNAGSQRPGITTAAAGSEGGVPFPTASIMARLAAHSEELENETRRLAEAVTALTADRDRLITRIASLERSLEDVTGSTKRPPLPPAPAAASPTAASPTATSSTAVSPPATSPTAASPPVVPLASAAMAALMAPVPLAARDQITPNMDTPAPPPSAPAATDPAAARRSANAIAATPEAEVPAKIEVGVDVGGAASFDGLRGLWNATRAVDAALFDGLRPLVVARESKSRSADLRLIVGPLANVDAATRLCVALSIERRYCQPTAFEGQELAVPEREPERRPIASSQRKAAPTTNQRTPSRPKS